MLEITEYKGTIGRIAVTITYISGSFEASSLEEFLGTSTGQLLKGSAIKQIFFSNSSTLYYAEIGYDTQWYIVATTGEYT